MSASYVSSQVLKTITKDGRTIAVNLVDKTGAWIHPAGLTASSVTDKFSAAVEQNFDKIGSETTAVAMKESDHQSPADRRTHYTAYELDAQNKKVRMRVHAHSRLEAQT
ncbi:hypothetical protein BKA66DRAFT_573883 [Pyrenochaeta sp. MPI-SDFR-AT-0127]|nr:hypothetical protein BKA66DRAFT_573883 [Pyrenochaeta sp. MPI-SDFR-AT-0127]